MIVEVAPLEPFSGPAVAALEAEAARYGAFLGLPAEVRVGATPRAGVTASPLAEPSRRTRG